MLLYKYRRFNSQLNLREEQLSGEV